MMTDLIATNPWANNNTSIDNKLTIFAEKLIEIAGKELRENDHTRKQCLEQFREWILKNQDIQNCLTDDNFLLRFLRMKKFSIPMAQQTLLKYLNFRKRFKHIMLDLDYKNDKINEIIRNGYIFASPYRDTNGRRIIIYNLGNFNPHKYTSTDMGRAHAITYETMVADEENQILGLNHVGNLEGASPALVTLWSISEFAGIVRWGEQSFPMRHKEMNLLNLPNGLKYVYDFVHTTIKSQKLKERFVIHNSLTDLHKKVEKSALPLELGGTMPMREMIELWMRELESKREILLSYDKMNLLSDRGIIRSNRPQEKDKTGTGSLAGSFRKLEVD